MEHSEIRIALIHRPQLRQCHRPVSAHRNGHHARINDFAHGMFDSRIAALDVAREAFDVSGIDESERFDRIGRLAYWINEEGTNEARLTSDCIRAVANPP
jgi:hypothetical protein